MSNDQLPSQENIEKTYPLAPIQVGMLIKYICQQSNLYIIQVRRSLTGNLHIPTFEKAWIQVVERNPIFRTSFMWENETCACQVKSAVIPIIHMDIKNLSPLEQENELEKFNDMDREKGFDLSLAPLMRVALFRIGEDAYEMLWSCHHIIMDGNSIPHVLNEFQNLYASILAEKAQPELTRTIFPNYVQWLKDKDFAEAKIFWRKNLESFKTPLSLAVLEKKGYEKEDIVDRKSEYLFLNAEETQRLNAPAKSMKLFSVFRLVQAAWGLLLHHYTGEEKVIFGIVVSTRSPEVKGAESIIGPCINTIPFLLQIKSEDTVNAYLKGINERMFRILKGPYLCPLGEILRSALGSSQFDLFETVLNFHQQLDPNTSATESLKISADPHRSRMGSNWSEFAISLNIISGPEMILRINYDSNRFEKALIKQILIDLKDLMLELALNSEKPLSSLSLTNKEKSS